MAEESVSTWLAKFESENSGKQQIKVEKSKQQDMGD